MVIRFENGTTAIANCNNVKIIKKKGASDTTKDIKLVSQTDGANINIKESLKKKLEINEWGVYNSEHDLKNKVKTKENVPEKFNKLIDMVISKVGTIYDELKGLESHLKTETNLSFDSITICVSELQAYINALKSENNIVGPG